LLIRIDQNPSHFPIFFHRARVWADFIEGKVDDPVVVLIQRDLYRQALEFFPEDRVHRLPDRLEDQIEKTLALSHKSRQTIYRHNTYCQFGQTYEALQSPRLMSHFSNVLFFGPPGKAQMYSHFWIHGDIDAKMLRYPCHNKCRLLTGPGFAFPAEATFTPEEGDDILFWTGHEIPADILDPIHFALADEQVCVKHLDRNQGLPNPNGRFLCTDAGPHIQELAQSFSNFWVFASQRKDLERCYALESAGLAHHLGWSPAMGRQKIAKAISHFRTHSTCFSRSQSSNSPVFFEKLFKLAIRPDLPPSSGISRL